MRGDTAQGTVDFVMEECCNCGMPFYLTKDLQNRLRKEPGTSFWCPKGHGQHYTGETPEQKLKKQLAAAQAEAEFAYQKLGEERETSEHFKRRLSSVRGHLTRAKNQLLKGNCPCCDEHFDDLEQHITTQHPDFELEPIEEQADVEPPKRKRGRPRKNPLPDIPSKTATTKDEVR